MASGLRDCVAALCTTTAADGHQSKPGQGLPRCVSPSFSYPRCRGVCVFVEFFPCCPRPEGYVDSLQVTAFVHSKTCGFDFQARDFLLLAYSWLPVLWFASLRILQPEGNTNPRRLYRELIRGICLPEALRFALSLGSKRVIQRYVCSRLFYYSSVCRQATPTTRCRHRFCGRLSTALWCLWPRSVVVRPLSLVPHCMVHMVLYVGVSLTSAVWSELNPGLTCHFMLQHFSYCDHLLV